METNTLDEFFLLKDTFPILYRAPNVHLGLLSSAKAGSGRAYYHLSNCFQNYEAPDKVLGYPSQKLLQKAVNYAEDDVVLQSWLAPNDKKTTILEGKKYNDKQEGERLYYLALETGDSNQLLEAFNKGFMNAQVEIARSKENKEEAFQTYIQAGDCGVADGYFFAAIMIERKLIITKDYSCSTLFKQALECGQIQSGRKLIDIYLLEDNVIEAERVTRLVSMQLEITFMQKKILKQLKDTT